MAAVKRKAPASASQRRSPSSSSSSSSDDEIEAQVDAPLVSSKGKPLLQRTNAAAYESESGSDSDSDSDSDPQPPAPPVRAPRAPAPRAPAPRAPAPAPRAPAPAPPVRAAEPVIVRQKPSESKDKDKEEEEEEEEGKDSAEEPEKKKPKLSASAAARIWSQQDEMALLRALSQFRAKTGSLPLSKDYGSFFLTVRGSIGFPLTQKQLKNKIKKMKENCSKKKKGANAKFSKPHDKLIFDMSAKLFNGAEAQVEAEAEAEGGHNGDALPKSNFHFLKSFVENMIRGQEMPTSLTVEDVVAQIGQSRAQKMNAQIKELRAREHSIKAALFKMMDS